MHTIFTDIETYTDFFYIGFKRLHDGKRVGVEFSRRNPRYDRDYVRRVLLRNETVGFNSLPFDLPLIWYSLDIEVDYNMIKRKADGIIKGGLKPWEVEDFLGIRLPWELRNRHIDLIEPQPNAFASLKTLNGRMHGNRLQDLPYPPDMILNDRQMDDVADYCLHSDLDATENLFNTLAEPLQLRRALGEKHDQYFMCKSDSQIGEAIVKKRVEQITGRKPERASVRAGHTFRYPVPDFMKFETPELQAIVDRLRETDFMIKSDGKVDMPEWLASTQITIGATTYQMGIGGLHSTESNRAVFSDDDFQLVDADVASQYPSIILLLGLYPQAMGPAFLEAYADIKAERLRAKKRAKVLKAELKTVEVDFEQFGEDAVKHAKLVREQELLECSVIDKGGKIQLNGVYGKLGSRYSVLYAPHLMISVTLTGQLTLLMLIERAERAGIPVVSGNTDGVLFRCPRHLYDGLDGDRLRASALEAICSQWEQDTTLDLEFGEYENVYNQSVNSYFAIKPDGAHKRKGPLGNPWNKDPSDFDPVRGQLMKNPQATICSDAALALIKDGTPIEETIRASRDIREFVTVIKVSKGGTWEPHPERHATPVKSRIEFENHPTIEHYGLAYQGGGGYLGKVVRYYWGVNGAPIFESQPHPTTGNFKKVPKSEGAIPCMDLPTDFPTDIDYDRYVAETESILRDLGYYGVIKPPEKRIRITKANRVEVLSKWSVAP